MGNVMSEEEFDLFVIGGGSGGVRAARWSAGLGAKVAICESDRYGGTCVIRGCIPKKFLVYASHFHEEARAAKEYGWDVGECSFNWNRFKQTRDKEIARLSGLYHGMLQKNNVEIIPGHGKILSPNQVQVAQKSYKTKRILVTTGSRPFVPEIPGIQYAITSNHIFEMEMQPQKIAIIGSGYIGLEFAGIFAGLGSEVHVFVRSGNILNGFDVDATRFLKMEMEKKGIQFHDNILVDSIEKIDQGLKINSSSKPLIVDCVLNATGRIPNTQTLGLDDIGLETKENGAIHVDARYQTNIAGIYALGDCTDRMNLTPIATAEGTALAEALFSDNPGKAINYELTPSAIFSQPPMATVGYTQKEAQDKSIDLDIYVSEFKALKHSISGINERFYIKVLVDKKNDRVVGAHCVGMEAPEIMQGIAIAVNSGATKSDFDKTIGIHPTMAEEFCTLRTKLEN